MTYINTINIAILIVFFIALIVTVASIVQLVNYNSSALVPMIVGIVLMLGAAGAMAFRVINGKKRFEERVDAAVHNLEGTMAQVVEFQRYFSENIYKKDDLISMLSYI